MTQPKQYRLVTEDRMDTFEANLTAQVKAEVEPQIRSDLDASYAALDTNGKIATSALPSLAIGDTFTATSDAAMTALTAQTGDMCVRSDLKKTFRLAVNDPTVLANWVEMIAAGGVTSVDGQTGVVNLTYSRVATTGVPAADGTAALGTSTAAARADHVHPATSGNEAMSTGFKGEYNSANTYNQGDLVSWKGKVFLAHTAIPAGGLKPTRTVMPRLVNSAVIAPTSSTYTASAANSCQQGDLLLMIATTGTGNTVDLTPAPSTSGPQGWTLLGQSRSTNGSNFTNELAIFYKNATSAEATSATTFYGPTFGTTSPIPVWTIRAYRFATPGVFAFATQNTNVGSTTPTLTVPALSMDVLIASDYDAAAAAGAPAVGGPTTQTYGGGGSGYARLGVTDDATTYPNGGTVPTHSVTGYPSTPLQGNTATVALVGQTLTSPTATLKVADGWYEMPFRSQAAPLLLARTELTSTTASSFSVATSSVYQPIPGSTTSFIAPASGTVRVKMRFYGYTTGGTGLVDAYIDGFPSAATNPFQMTNTSSTALTHETYITGLVPGYSYSINPMLGVSGSYTAQVQWGPVAPFTFEIWEG